MRLISPLRTSVLNTAVEKSKSVARSNESPRSRILRSFLAGSYEIPMFISYIQSNNCQVSHQLQAVDSKFQDEGVAAMRALFNVHAGEFLVGEHIQRNYKNVKVWLPAKDTGTDLLIASSNSKRSVSLQVKHSRD